MRKVIACLGSLSLVSGKIYFSETFSEGWEKRWTHSTWKESAGSQGKFELSTGKFFKDAVEDAGIHSPVDARHYTISAEFPTFSNEGKELYIQYQAKYEQDIDCGGGYVKVGPKMEDATQFGDPTVYNVMFGPDKCGYEKRTHVIFQYKGKNVLKKANVEYKQDDAGISHLYRLVIKPDNTARVEIDEEKVYEGSMKEDWELLLPKQIPDPEDAKPSDWVEDSMMDDPTDKMPDDWATEKKIIDPEASKPNDWDDDEDGEWEAPQKDNPEYKGEWTVKRISNPAYKGFWEAKKIDNPEYVDDDAVYKYPEFGFIGFDLWQVKAGSIFDNIIITDSQEEADGFAAKWKALNAHEKEAKKAEDDAAKANEKKKEDEDDDDDDMDDKAEAKTEDI